MIESFEQTRYRCSWCRKSWRSKQAAEAHEHNGCHKNPETRTCATCVQFAPAEYGGSGYGEEISSAAFCTAGVTISEFPQDRPKGCEKWVTSER